MNSNTLDGVDGRTHELVQISLELETLRNSLRDLISREPRLQNYLNEGHEERKDRLLLVAGNAIRVLIKRDGLEQLTLIVKRDSTVRELKTKIRHAVDGAYHSKPGISSNPSRIKRISWKHVWKRYFLAFGRKKLEKDHWRLVDLSVSDLSEFHFVKRFRRK